MEGAVYRIPQCKNKYGSMQGSKAHNPEITRNQDNVRVTSQISSPIPAQTFPYS